MREKKKRPIGGYPSKLCTMGVLNRLVPGNFVAPPLVEHP